MKGDRRLGGYGEGGRGRERERGVMVQQHIVSNDSDGSCLPYSSHCHLTDTLFDIHSQASVW